MTVNTVVFESQFLNAVVLCSLNVINSFLNFHCTPCQNGHLHLNHSTHPQKLSMLVLEMPDLFFTINQNSPLFCGANPPTQIVPVASPEQSWCGSLR